MTRSKKNPVILFAHDSGSMPVGKATNVGVSVEGKLLASVRLAQTQFGKAVSAMVSQGFLRAVSVGFAPLEYDFAKSASRQNGIHFVKPELLEISILPIPANASCLLQSISGDGKSASPSKAKKMRVLALMKIKPAPPVRVRPRSELIANLRAVRAMR